MRSNEQTMPSARGSARAGQPGAGAAARSPGRRARAATRRTPATSAVPAGRTTASGRTGDAGERLVVGVVVGDRVAGEHVGRADDLAQSARRSSCGQSRQGSHTTRVYAARPRGQAVA